MSIRFSKMHSLGNDFMVVDGVNQVINWSPSQIQDMADRHCGVGFDQLLLLEAPTDEHSDFNYRIFNASGGEVAQCGNGARCLGRFIHEKQLSDKPNLHLTTKSRQITVSHATGDQYSVEMGKPEFTPEHIPFKAAQQQPEYTLELANKSVPVRVLSMGNPHMVISAAYSSAEIETLGPQLMIHQAFPEGVNVEFMTIIDPQTIQLRVFERGVGETQACGSGACAAVVAGRQAQQLAEKVTVYLPGGDLTVSWAGGDAAVTLTGTTSFVYDAVLS